MSVEMAYIYASKLLHTIVMIVCILSMSWPAFMRKVQNENELY